VNKSVGSIQTLQQNLPVRITKHDVDADSSSRDAIGQILAEAGRIDVLVNNAGIGTMGSVEETTLSDFRSTMKTNLFVLCAASRRSFPGCISRAEAASLM
jgi:NAD(P)-dependent dehydrogenase (short-subunit alcohol dehydrogenase family)